MSNALFLPRELFEPVPPARATPAPAGPVTAPLPRRRAQFLSGEAVAADLMQGLVEAVEPPPAPHERRRAPRPAHARGVDLYIA
jgi:hypothetical protein